MSPVAQRVLADWTTLRVGGPAASWLTAESDDDIRTAVDSGADLLILGGGSNLVVCDAGTNATVLRIATRGVNATKGDGYVDLEVMAGESWDDLVSLCVSEGWSGIEAMAGIPGLVGATPVQNVGAYGQEVADVITSVRVLDRSVGQELLLSAEQCGFGYRSSRFKSEPGRWVILAVTLRLAITNDGLVRYAELARALSVDPGDVAPIDDIRAAVLHLRAAKGMLLDPHDHDTWSAGSFFTNPIVDDNTAARIDSACPRYPSVSGTKLSAAWLIQRSGIEPGYALAGSRAAVSTKHVLALTNRGGATATELLELADAIVARVRTAHAITLVPEPVIVRA